MQVWSDRFFPRAVPPARAAPSAGFGCPLDDGIPTQTGPALFQTGSAPGIRPAESSPPATLQAALLRPAHPTYRFCRACCRRRLERQPAAQPAVSGFSLPASLAFERVFSAPGHAGCSLGLALSGLAHADLAGISPCRSAHAFCGKESVRTRSRRRLSVSVSQRWVSPLVVRATHMRHNPRRVSAPVRSRSFERVPSTRGYVFT